MGTCKEEGPQTLRANCVAGHFLELSFGAQHLDVHGRPLHNGLVRYFGMGSTVACFHHEVIAPSAVVLPAPQITYNLRPQQAWLQQEIRELAKVCHAAFVPPHHSMLPNVIKLCLPEKASINHPW